MPGGGDILKAEEIIEALEAHYTTQRDCLFFDELRIGTGYGEGAEQRIDAWVMYGIPSKQFRRVAFEVKVSRSDFLAELKKPLKRRYALMLSNEFFFATPPGLIRAGELPAECGLVEVYETALECLEAQFGGGNLYGLRRSTAADKLYWKHAAPWRDTHPPSWRFVASIVRRALRDGPKVMP